LTYMTFSKFGSKFELLRKKHSEKCTGVHPLSYFV
jgi:hypothetical protein